MVGSVGSIPGGAGVTGGASLLFPLLIRGPGIVSSDSVSSVVVPLISDAM